MTSILFYSITFHIEEIDFIHFDTLCVHVGCQMCGCEKIP